MLPSHGCFFGDDDPPLPDPRFRHIPPGEPRNTLSSMREKIGDHFVEQRSKEFYERRTQNAEEKRHLKTLRNETLAASVGGILDPSLAGRSWSKDGVIGRPCPGKTTGRWSGRTTSNVRECGGPTQRRDPTAHEKMHMVKCVFDKVAEASVKEVSELSNAAKHQLEKRFAYPFQRLMGWVKLKDMLEEFIFKQRCGLKGLRPFGSTKPTSNGSQGLGARLRPHRPKIPTKQQPLNAVLRKIGTWFELCSAVAVEEFSFARLWESRCCLQAMQFEI